MHDAKFYDKLSEKMLPVDDKRHLLSVSQHAAGGSGGRPLSARTGFGGSTRGSVVSLGSERGATSRAAGSVDGGSPT
jgi:hypothetical protein